MRARARGEARTARDRGAGSGTASAPARAMLRAGVALVVAAVVSSTAGADDDTISDEPPAAAPTPKRPELDVRVGLEGGGAPLLRAPDGPIALTTAQTSMSLFVRASLPVRSARGVELAWIPGRGISVALQSGDLHLGPVQLRLIDIGVFYATNLPVTVSRVTRHWDLVIGAGAELALRRGFGLVVDARLFAPIDLWDVVTRYGDTARLIGEEIVGGVQLWGGAAYRW
jgi:hypothetical protein